MDKIVSEFLRRENNAKRKAKKRDRQKAEIIRAKRMVEPITLDQRTKNQYHDPDEREFKTLEMPEGCKLATDL